MVYSIVSRAGPARVSYDCIVQDNVQNAYFRIKSVSFVEFIQKRMA